MIDRVIVFGLHHHYIVIVSSMSIQLMYLGTKNLGGNIQICQKVKAIVTRPTSYSHVPSLRLPHMKI